MTASVFADNDMGLSSIGVAFSAASLLLLAVAAATDLRDRRIPDEVTIAVAAIGLAQALLFRPGSVWISLVVASLVFFGLAVLSHHRIVGGGDLKLISAATLLVPPTQVGRLLVDIALAGGAVSCLYLAARLALRTQASPDAPRRAPRAGALAAAVNAERLRVLAGGPMPYALAIFAGACLYAVNGVASCSSALSCSP